MKPRVLLAEDDVSIQDMLRFVLRHHCGFDVAGEAADGITALKLCESLHPEVLLADLRLPRLDGVGLLQQIRARGLHVPTVFYTGTEHEGQLREALAVHPEGFVHKHDSLSELTQALRAAIAGQIFYSATPARLQADQPVHDIPLDRLTVAERTLLRLIASGKTIGEAAALIGKSEFATAHERERLMEKLGVADSADLIRVAVRLTHFREDS
jgi:two-component system, NarL family, response regulator NreC